MNSTVLLVEDDADDAFLFQNALAKSAAEVTLRFARDGEEAEAYLSGAGDDEDRKRRPAPDLILLDLKLPRLSGLEFLERRSWARGAGRIPVVVFTSSRETSDVESAYALGASRYLVKPSDFRGLIEAVRAINVYLGAIRRDPGISIEQNGVPWPTGALQKPPPKA